MPLGSILTRGAAISVSPSPRISARLHDRPTRGMLCTRAAALTQVQQPAGHRPRLAFRELVTAAPVLGVEIQSVEVRRPDDFSAAFAALSSGRVHALLALGNPINFRGRQLIADFALRNRLPSIYDERLFVDAGGLMSYAPSFTDLFRRAATYVDKILKGAKPADLPVEQPTKFELVINVKTARILGLTIRPSLLLRADHLLE
jgi:ABC-type uncharacterized transport system substrate-binding protein